MKTALSVSSIKFLKLSLLAGIWIGLSACANDNAQSDTKAADVACYGEGAKAQMDDGTNFASCEVKNNVGHTYASSKSISGGILIDQQSVDFNTGEVLIDDETWVDDNYGMNEGASAGAVCKEAVAKPVVDSQGRSWGFEKGASCIAL